MRISPLLLAFVFLVGCGGNGGSDSAPVTNERLQPAAPRGADPDPGPPPIVFDTTEPPPPIIEIPVRPPTPLPQPPPPPAPPAAAPGSCDVRETESFCFTYTGSGWTAEEAEAQCGEAPSSSYRRGACPTANRVATCVFRRPSDPTLEIVYTYYAPYDLGLAEVACPGEFTRVP